MNSIDELREFLLSEKRLVIIVVNYDRIHQRSFGGFQEVYDQCFEDLKKYDSVTIMWPSVDEWGHYRVCAVDNPYQYAEEHTNENLRYTVVELYG